jgi:kynureninase
MDDLETILESEAERIALMLLPGVQYYNGQLLDMAALCRLARRHGVTIALDLAHAVGNVPLSLHDWAPDFAVWCSYKYLNGGPGAIGGMFVSERHTNGDGPAHLQGWWGNREESRFRMQPGFDAARGIESWQLSNPPILSLAPVVASLELFDAAGMQALSEKSRTLTGYLDFLLRHRLADRIRPITPSDARGCQLSLRIEGGGPDPREVFRRLEALNVAADWREPDVIRVAPVPLYNRYEDVYEFVQRLEAAIGEPAART